MVQLFPEGSLTKCSPQEHWPDLRVTKPPVRRSQTKRSRASTKPTKDSSGDEHFVTISRSGNGPPRIQCSASLKPYKEHIIADALRKFVDCLDGLENDSPSSEVRPGLASQTPAVLQPEIASISYPFAPSTKRRRANSPLTQCGSDAGLNAGHGRDRDRDGRRPPERLIALHPGNRDKCEEFFRLGFQAIQQIDCRFIAKRWIKKIEPKKQVRHPYNGGRREPRDPERTKPQWWPPGVLHKEPDHIDRNNRITLLTYLIMQTGSPLLVSEDTGCTPYVSELEEVTRPYRAELKNAKSWDILQDMFKTRRYMELIEYECYDAETTVVNVVDRCEATRRAQGEPKNVIDDDDEIECPRITTPDSDEDEEGYRCRHPNDQTSDVKPRLTPPRSSLSSPALKTHRAQEHLMQRAASQDRQSYDTAPPAQLMMKPDYAGRPSYPFSNVSEHRSALHNVSQYESSVMYPHVQPLEHHMYQQMHGAVSELQTRPDFVTHPMRSSEESPMSHWSANVPPELLYPMQYLGTPSHAPSMQQPTSEHAVYEQNIYQTHQHDQDQPIHYHTPFFDQPPPPFPEERESTTPRWIAFRPASNTPLPRMLTPPTANDNLLTPSTNNGSLYQERMCEHQDFA